MKKNKSSHAALRAFRKKKGIPWTLLATVAGLGLSLAFSGCQLLKKSEPFACSLVELKENPSTGYYDAVVMVERMTLKNPLKSRFSLITPTSSFALQDLVFTEDGTDPSLLEEGDVFIVPLKKPDWKLFIREGEDTYCAENFWDMLPVDDQWHPLKSEAAEVAESIEVEITDLIIKPVPGYLPDEWEKTEETMPEYEDPCGRILYQKIRGDEIKEDVSILYCPITEDEKSQVETRGATNFLKGWTDWTKTEGRPAEIAGRNAIVWDMQGIGQYGWSFRYIYIDMDLVIEINIEADPLEWVKSPQEKMLEGRSKRLFLRYGYGPVGEEGWQVLIDLRLNGEGVFYKRSRTGERVKKPFQLSEEEVSRVESSLAENSFFELSSRSGPPGGTTSFISVSYRDKIQTVELKNVKQPQFQNIEKILRSAVLPKVDEKQPVF